MKRELKPAKSFSDASCISTHCRAYPDEKGIETRSIRRAYRRDAQNCRAYPDEKGIETSSIDGKLPALVDIAEPIPMKRELKLDVNRLVIELAPRYCRAYPDEKGIETKLRPGIGIEVQDRIAEPIPMKRELKRRWRTHHRPPEAGIAEPIPMKRELKHQPQDTHARCYGLLQSLSR